MKNYVKTFVVGCMLLLAHIGQSSESKFSKKKEVLEIESFNEVSFNQSSRKSDYEQQKKLYLGLVESIAIGSVVGAAEVAMPGQMLSYAMNCAIKNEPFIFSKSYAGFMVNALGQMPITALQKGAQFVGSQQVETYQGRSLSEIQKIVISYFSGVAGAVIDTPCNAIQLFLQDKAHIGKTTRQAIKELGSKSFRGFGVNAFAKEGLFAVGYQYLAGKATHKLNPYVGDNIGAVALGGSVAGIITAVGTHPGTVIRNMMQSDLSRNKSIYKNGLQAASEICKKDGFAGLFKGLTARGARVAIAVPLYVAYTKAIESQLKEFKK